jgi:hypothetical protein
MEQNLLNSDNCSVAFTLFTSLSCYSSASFKCVQLSWPYTYSEIDSKELFGIEFIPCLLFTLKGRLSEISQGRKH